ncbi:hypothetical protein L7F22_013003 [Adiantum nelumboides]|nr:hypothetical protein [Adiantum nelumboides]MCO5559404.1 hypothetical protein [Adiantum nelumboides]
MGYAQWIKVTLQIVSSGGTMLDVKNAKLDYGKWYKATPTKDKDTEVVSPRGDTTSHGSPLVFASCDHENSPLGAQGSVDVYKGTSKVLTIDWDCPYIGSNILNATYHESNKYVIQQNPTSVSSGGAIGHITYTFVKL